MATQTFFWGGQWWKPEDKAAFAKWLSAHGASFAGWSSRHPDLAGRVFGGASTGPAGHGSVSVADWAGQQYDASVAPALADIEKERARAKADSEAYMQNVKGIYGALAGMLGDVGPSISNNYTAAANTELAGGRGFGDQEAARGVAAGDKAAGYLTAAGAPQAAIEGVKAAAGGKESGDLVYGVGGYIPATTTAREGAAFASAGAMLPAQATGTGQLALRSALSDAMKNDTAFSDKVAELKAGRPAAIQKIIQDFMEQDRAERALRLQEGYLNNTQRTTDAKLTGVDPVTGQPTYEATYDKAKIRADAAKARQAQKSKNQATHAAAIKAREDAFASARHAMAQEAKKYAGHALTLKEQVQWSVKNHKPVSQAPKTGGGVSYEQAKRQLFAEYSDVLRYATGAGRAALKKRLNAMIDEVLQSYGLHKTSTGGRAAAQPAWAIAGAGPR